MEQELVVKQLPAWELPCKQCGSRDYMHSVVIVPGKERHNCAHCGSNVKNATKPCKICGCAEFGTYISNPSDRSRFICADCGAHRSVYMVTQFDEHLGVSSSEGRSIVVKFDRFRIICTLSVPGWHSNRVTNIQVFSAYHAFGAVVRQLVEFDPKAPKSTWTHKKGSISNEAARRRLYGTFINWWAMYVHPTEEIIQAQKKMFSCAGEFPEWVLDSPRIWENDFAVRDMSKYKGACIILMSQSTRSWSFGYNKDGSFDFPSPDKWMDSLVPGEKTPKAARVTLMNMPGGLKKDCAYGFFDKESLELLGRPRTTRMEFLAWDYIATNKHTTKNRPWIKTCLLKADESQLKKAFCLYREHMSRFAQRSDITLRKIKCISEFFGWLSDMDEPFNGTSITKLVEKVCRWHQDAKLRRASEECKKLGITLDFPTVSPLKALPTNLPADVIDLRVYTTAEQIGNDGGEMGHCVCSYINKACGLYNSYVCHILTLTVADGVTSKGVQKTARATAEVTYDGRLIQSRGPYNGKNKASEMLAAIINDWTREWPETDRTMVTDSVRLVAWKTLTGRNVDAVWTQELQDEIDSIKEYTICDSELIGKSDVLDENRPMVDYFDLDAPFED